MEEGTDICIEEGKDPVQIIERKAKKSAFFRLSDILGIVNRNGVKSIVFSWGDDDRIRVSVPKRHLKMRQFLETD